MKLLDFMIIGAQKAGTTALSRFLSEHPALVIAKGKEAHLFSRPGVLESWGQAEIEQGYSAYFEGEDTRLCWGEATPIYLYWPPIIPALKRYNPALKVIIQLRDPVARAISQYQMESGRQDEWLPLWLALLAEPLRLWWAGRSLNHAQRCHSYVARGMYYRQLAWVRRHFADDQILIVENETLRHEHAATLAKVCRFLAVPECDIPPAKVFEGDYSRNKSWSMRYLIEPFLRWRFRTSNRQLQQLLEEMGQPADWPWLHR